MNHDGYLDIVIAEHRRHAPRASTATAPVMPPWTDVALQHAHRAARRESSPVVADINGDGWPDVVMGGEDGDAQRALGRRRRAAAGLPDPARRRGARHAGAVRLRRRRQDRDRAGGLGRATSTCGTTTSRSRPARLPPWPQFHHDAQRTGFFDTPPTRGRRRTGGAGRPARVEFAAAGAESRARRHAHRAVGVPGGSRGRAVRARGLRSQRAPRARRSRSGVAPAGPLLGRAGTCATRTARRRAARRLLRALRSSAREAHTQAGRACCADAPARSGAARAPRSRAAHAPRLTASRARRVVCARPPRPTAAEEPRMSVRVRFAPSPTGYPARRRGAHRALQLPVRARARRRVRAAHRGHRRRALDRRIGRRHPRQHALARARVGRGPGRGRRARPVLSERAPRALRAPRRRAASRPAAPTRATARAEELEARRAAQLARGEAPRYDGRCRALDAADARARARPRAGRAALRFALPGTARPRGTTSCAARVDVPERRARRLRAAALRRPADLQLRVRRRRPRDGRSRTSSAATITSRTRRASCCSTRRSAGRRRSSRTCR